MIKQKPKKPSFVPKAASVEKTVAVPKATPEEKPVAVPKATPVKKAAASPKATPVKKAAASPKATSTKKAAASPKVTSTKKAAASPKATPVKKAAAVPKAPSSTPRRRSVSEEARPMASAPSTPRSSRKQAPPGSIKRLSYKPLLEALVTEAVCCTCKKNECRTSRCNCVRNGVPCARGRCKCSLGKCTNMPNGPEDEKLRYSSLKRPLNPDASQGDVNLIASGRTPYKRFHRPFMVDLRVEVRYQNRRNVFIVPSDTLFRELAIEAATFYDVISDKSEANNIAATLFDSTGAVCPPNTKIALMTVYDDEHPLVLRCRKARKRQSLAMSEEDEEDEDNFIAGRDSMLSDHEDDDDDGGAAEPARKRRRSSMRSRREEDDDDDGAASMSQTSFSLDYEEFPGILHGSQSSQLPYGSCSIPHCHAAVDGSTSSCVPGCLFVISQGGTMIGLESHPFGDDKVIKVCDEFVVTEHGNLYMCRVDKGEVSFTVPPQMDQLVRMNGGQRFNVQCATSTEDELIVVSDERLFAINKASGAVRAMLPGVRVASVSSSRSFACAVDFEGNVYVWGETIDLGVPSSLEPSVVETDEPIREAACGLSHILLLTRGGELYAFGRGDEGRLGLDSEESQYTPKKLTKFVNEKNESLDEKSRFVSIACGRYHSAAVTEDGALYTWGSGKFGQLGLGSQSNQSIPRRVWGLRNIRITRVACEVLSTAACDSRGNIWTCGFRMTPAHDAAQPAQSSDFLGGYASDVLGCIPHFTLNDQHISQISACESGFFLALRGEYDSSGESESNPLALEDGDLEL